MNVVQRIREEWMPDPETRVARSADASFTAGWLREHGVKFESGEQADRAARSITWTRWLVETGRLSDRSETP